ncbi:MAG TPA: RcpC/CpaB family pilus assembly protein [Solirubrobacteraceae bacterium]|nr:RcpC/CpaB family pilus assembly protein [Solirubrobacteraceae bacterium]
MKLPQRRMSRPNLGGLMATRQGAIVFALIAAVCATGILLFAVSRYKTTAVTQPTASAQATVLVATSQIAKGTPGDEIASRGLYRSTPVAASQVSAGAISDASALAGRQTTTTILAGQQLTSQDLSSQPRLIDGLAPDQRAISLSIGDVAGSVPLLQTGDEVDLYAQLSKGGETLNVLLERGAPVLQTPSAPAPTAATTAAGTSTTATTASSTTTPAASSSAGALVLGVTTSQVARVIYAAQNDQLYIALRPTHANHTPSVITNQSAVIAGALSDNSTGARP